MEKIIQDKELGRILLRTSPRAKRYSIKITNEEVVGIMPLGGDEKLLRSFIEENRARLLLHVQKRAARMPEGLSYGPLVLNEQTELQTYSFILSILCRPQQNYVMSLKDHTLFIACPASTDFTRPDVQDLLRNMLTQALRHEAKRLLPGRLRHLAEQHRFTYTDVKIQSSRSRWGSCSARRSINLSLSLMLLPEHLIDYVLLHELCHTIEMNHSDRFWALLDKATSGRSRALRAELKGYHTL